MKSQEARHGEAIRRLTDELERWGVDEASPKAHDFVRWMVAEGWRPVGRAVEHPTRGGKVQDHERVDQLLDDARAKIAEARERIAGRESA